MNDHDFQSMLDCKCFTTCITKLFQFCFGRTFIQVEVDDERKRKQQNQLDAILKSSETRSQSDGSLATRSRPAIILKICVTFVFLIFFVCFSFNILKSVLNFFAFIFYTDFLFCVFWSVFLCVESVCVWIFCVEMLKYLQQIEFSHRFFTSAILLCYSVPDPLGHQISISMSERVWD